MKNRVLSIILSFGIILSNFSSSFAVIAEDGTGTTEPETTVATETNTEPTTEEQSETEDISSPTEENSDANQEESQDDEPANEETVEVKIVLNKDSIYYGQELPFDETGIVDEDFYKFVDATDEQKQVESDILKSAVSLKADLVEGQVASNSDAKYGIAVITDSDNLIDGNTTYTVATDSLDFSIYGNYSPNKFANIQVGEDNITYLTVADNYFISKSDDLATFSSNRIPLADILNNDNKYYIRNMKEDSDDYMAISSAIDADTAPGIIMPEYVTVSGIDFSKTTVTNTSVNVSFTVYAKADRINISFGKKINNEVNEYTNQIIEPTGQISSDEKNEFVITYTFDKTKYSNEEIRNITLSVTANGHTQVKDNIPIKDANGVSTDVVIIDAIKPIIVDTQNSWTEGNHQPEYITYRLTVEDHETSIVSVEYSYDKNKWSSVNYSNPDDVQVKIPYSSDSSILYVRAVDEAGNTEIFKKTAEGFWVSDDEASDSDIDKIVSSFEDMSFELFYIRDEQYYKIESTDLFHTNWFSNTINMPLQIRIKANEDDKIYINDTNISTYKHFESKTSEDGTEVKVFDYFYFDLPMGFDSDLNIAINDRKHPFPFKSTLISSQLGFEIHSSHITIEDDNATVQVYNPEFASENVSVVNKWYGINEKDGTFNIHIDDNADGSGIQSIEINDDGSSINATEEYPITFTSDKGEVSNITGTLITQKFNSETEKITKVDVSIPLEVFSDGDHILKITVVDNAGNTQTGFTSISNNDTQPDNSTLEFSTDFNAPTGSIDLLTSSIPIDGYDWFDTVTPIEFTFSINDGANGYPYKVIWKANPDADWKDAIVFPFKEGGATRTNVVTDELATDEKYDENHSNTVSAIFYDEAGNPSDDSSVNTKTIYKDVSNPEIDHVKVCHEPESAAKKIIRVLSFGLFYNDDISITVEAHDAEHDSQLNISSLQISLDGGKTYSSYNVTSDDSHSDRKEFHYTIHGLDEVQSGILMFKITDRFGHESFKVERIESDTNSGEPSTSTEDNGKNYIVEKIAPNVNVSLPDNDGSERNDGTVWYNSDKDITINVQDKDSGINNVVITVNGVEINNKLVSEDNSTTFVKGIDTALHEYHLSTDEITEYLRSSQQEPADGHYVVKVIVEDNAFNKGENQKDYYIDKESPIVGKIEFSIPSADDLSEGDVTDAEQYIEKLQYGYYFKTDLIATVNITDKAPSSELNEIEYVLVDYNNGVKGEEHPGKVAITSDPHPGNGSVDSIGTASFTIPANFKGQILVTAYDYVGNESVERTPDLFVVDTLEKHESEKHITITGLGTSSYTDSEGHPLFDTNVNLTVTITDTMSGIRDISYAISSEQDTQDNKTITISNTGHSVGQDLGDGWTITAMDENLVTEVTRNYSFSADNNNIQLTFAMTDRANNTSDRTSDIFSIDQTAPVINVAFDTPAGNNDYYRENRTATITVIERNFDASLISAAITNEIGGTPVLSFASNSNTEHVATLTFGEGDYTFGIEGSDRANHVATVNYSGGNERSFHVDMTSPTEIDNFDQFINELNNSFNSDKEMTFTITEHNFVPGQVNIRVYRTAAGNELTTENRKDCTSEYVSADKWTSTGDTHSISFKFTEDYVYQVTISATDAAGRTLAEKASPVFEIDKTAPVLKTPTNLDVLIFTNKNTETSATPLEFFDANIASIHYSVVSYQMKLNEDNIGYDMNVDSEDFDVKSNEVVISNEFFNQDGIYEVKSVAYDVAGNESDETTHTFVIQRDTDFLVYIPNSIKANQTGLYKFNEKGIRSADFEDIEIITYITQDKEFEVQVDGNVVESDDLDVTKDDRRINQVDMYDVTLKNSYISQNYNADTIDTDLTLNAVATNGDTEQVITLGHIYIDNVKPVGEYESALQNLGTFDGFYGMESRTVLIEGVSPDINVDRCEIQLNDTTLKNEDGGFVYDESAHTISFTIGKGYTDVKPTLVDKAGNINNLAMVKNVYVGGVFARWWYLFVLGGLAILAIPTGIIIAIIRKKIRPVSF